jgi:hypothetical protein
MSLIAVSDLEALHFETFALPYAVAVVLETTDK